MIKTNVMAGEAGHPTQHNLHARRSLSESVNARFDFGMVPNDKLAASANVAGWNAAVVGAVTDRSSIYNTGQRLVIPPGDYYVNGTLLVQSVMGLDIVGRGLDTRIIWVGPDDMPLFRLNHCRSCRLADLFILAEAPLHSAISVTRSGDVDDNIVSTANRFERLWVQGNHQMQYGIILGDGGTDANNDFMRFDDVMVANYIEAGWYIALSQVYNTLMLNCQALGDQVVSKYGVKTWDNLTGGIGWIGGGVGGHVLADFRLSHSYQPHKIEFFDSENSARLLESVGAFVSVEISDSRWCGNGLHKDGRCIVATPWCIGLSLRNCSLGDGNHPVRAMTFDVAPSRDADSSAFIMDNCTVFSSVENQTDLWENLVPIGRGNRRVTDEVEAEIEPLPL